MTTDTKNLLVIGLVWPEPSSSAAGSRMMQLLSGFSEKGYSITFASSAKRGEHSVDLTAMGVSVRSINVNDSRFDTFVNELNPDVVIFDRFVTEEQFGWRVSEQCPDAVRILDTEDLHFLRAARQNRTNGSEPPRKSDLISDVARREIASIYRCDLSLIISEAELNILKDIFDVPAHLLVYLPYLIEQLGEHQELQWPDYDERKGFMTIGNFRHKPNLDAVSYLRREIWPLIRRRQTDAEMHVYGAYPTQQVREWHSPSAGFFIHGRVESADAVFLRARVCLAPIRFGAGLKGKLVEAMLNGTPSITTSIGAEGIAGTHDWPGAICDDPEEFANVAIKIYCDKPQWERASRKGMTIINDRFDKGRHTGKFFDRLEDVMCNLKAHRAENFTGDMLMHHTMASTRYMSRWIEEKNKRK